MDAMGRAVETARMRIGNLRVMREDFEPRISTLPTSGKIVWWFSAPARVLNRDLRKARGVHAHDGEFGDVAAKFVEPLQ